jgi:two-component system phosphate regulon sensor histidine kinase PhoR
VTSRLRALSGSYRLRLALGYALIVVVLAGAWAWSLYGPLNATVLEQQRSHLTSIARAGSFALTRPGVPAGRTAQDLVVGTQLRVTVVASNGTVVADTAEDPARMENHASRPEIRAALGGAVGYDTRRSATLGTEQLYVAVPASLDGERVALRVSEPLGRIDQLAASARSTGLLLLGAALLAALYVGVRLSRSAAEPVLRLKRAAEEMAAGRLDVPIPVTEGELAGLAGALDALRGEIRARLSELTSGQATLRMVLDGLQAAVLLFDSDSITLANAATSRLFRSPAGGWEGARADQSGLPSSLAAQVARAVTAASSAVIEVGPDPQGRFYRVTCVPLDDPAAGGRVLIVIADVTDVRMLDQVRRDFVANASHELKTPTASIQLLADSAAAASEDGDVTQALVFAAQMRAEADRLRRLVVDLLDLSRLESAPEPGTITNVRAALSNALASHRSAASIAGLALSLDDRPVSGQDVYAVAEPTDVAVALDNLLANAIAYTEAGHVTVALEADASTVSIRVEDTGIGIPADHLPRIFERFYRVDGARSRASGGTGLGLALVKHVAERSGGSVEVASQIGGGSTFVVRLPRAK